MDSPPSAGCHDLIRDGVQLCSDADHVLEEFDQLFVSTSSTASNDRPMPKLSEQEEAIYEVLSR